MKDRSAREFIPVRIAVMTVSDSRTAATDTSGQALVDRLTETGHVLADRCIEPDNIYRIRETVSRWIAADDVNVIITTGGTGMTGRDSTPEAIRPLLDKELEGIGELFRWLSYRDIKTSTVASRALGGVANGTFVFCLPGSTGACKTGWDEIIAPQLDYRNGPCNMVELMPRLTEA
ncbi:MAG: molybdenum cofactor biosynthesis protein B [Thiohalobacterales bacterium]|nr:molybdenum cofactor biosynthesis protein B [Thiohalobacterales bacterium]